MSVMENSLEQDYLTQHLLNKTGYSLTDEDEMLYDVPIGIILLLSFFYGTISLIAVIGNTLVIWIVTTTRQMHTTTNFFIANLAMADVTIGVFAIPFQFQAAILQRWNLPDFMCPFCPFVQCVSVNVSVFTLTAIAIDRHRAILNPLKARPSKIISKIVIVFIWVSSLLLACPMAYGLRVKEMHHIVFHDNNTISNFTKPFCTFEYLTEMDILWYRYVLVLVQYLIPCCIISFVYIQMAFKLWGSKTPGNAQDSRDTTLLKNKKKVIKMLVIVVTLFLVCWLPLQSYNILQVTWPSINEYRFINIIWFCFDWLAMSNSCYNPFIYGIYNEKFKREFFRRFTICHKFGRNDSNITENDKTTMSVYTRASSLHFSHQHSTNFGRSMKEPRGFEPYNHENAASAEYNRLIMLNKNRNLSDKVI